MTGALDGIKVLDFSTLLPGPMATLWLADAGAEVVKVERPGTGDDMRGYQPQWHGDAVNFQMLNRGKRSLALDLKDPAALDALMPLVDAADILVEQFRPGVMDRLGLGHAALAERNPGLVYCSITGYGQTGPAAAEAGHDLNYLARTGLQSLSMGPPEHPVIPPALIADIAGGTYPALVNILMALRVRDRTGKGAHIDIAMADGLFPFLYWALGDAQTGGGAPGNSDALVTGGSPRYRLYTARDGGRVAVAALEPKFWAAFCDVVDLDPALRDDARDPAATTAGVARIIAAEPVAHWAPLLAAADCCCTIVQDVAQALDDPHFAARGTFDRDLSASGDTIRALPLPLAPALRGDPDPASPRLGAHNEDFA